MNPSLYTAVLIGLALVLVAMFAFGFYWLATKERPTPSKAPAPSRSSFTTIDEHEEWEAQAPYPDHAQDALRDSTSASPNPVHHRQSSFASPHFNAPVFEAASSFSEADHAQPSPDYFSYSPQWATDATPAPTHANGCPHCSSTRIDTLNIGRRAGSMLGSAAGATSGVAMALSGAEAGAAVGAIGGPIGAVFGGLAGAVIAGLLGSAAGSIVGSAVGGVLDDNVFDNHRCLSCGHTFGATLH
ncbi:MULTISPECIES: hypothetical protein [Burkholderia]|uniref:Glycine zipper domain-containing protein n=2 Tax=Burkholderia contaminans TaxID=488447 RepID=A0A250LDN2_9BURK|nr:MULTISPECIES: hypothetical protein [Burkholderia]UTP23400.1 hypothetical protein NMB33_06510 [Burkholderia sp. FXe9]HBN6128935.1 hypothetical protein [Clostridioides difficile]MCA7912554.1 hypothetical protein [Burkholderia contaminans]MCA8189102.1 hypothetical protein [Burkholderia contaminans]MCA8371359.1 hypothetical protein [Burkholderia contaminans]